MLYKTKSCFILLLICLISKSRAIENSSEIITQVEKLHEYSSENKSSFYHYVTEFPNTQARNDGNIFLKKPRILGDNFAGSVPKNKNEVLEELSNSLATLQYQPVVVLMDDTCKALLNAEYFTNNLLNKANIRNEFWLMKFNTSGVTSVLAQSRINSEEFKKYIQNEITQPTEIMPESKGSATFFAILKATQILPKNSAIIILAENRPIDEDLSQLAITNLRQKQIHLFVVWSGQHIFQGQEEKLLKEAAIYSSGTFYLGNYFNTTTDCKKIHKSFSDKLMKAKEEILIKKTVHTNEKIRFPIDYTVQNIDIIIEGNFHSAILSSPAGYTTNLLDVMSVQRLSPGSVSTHVRGNWAHVRFNTMKVTAKPVIGIWELNISGLPSNKIGYNVTVYAETELTISSEVVKSTKTGSLYASNPFIDNEIQLHINGKISNIENISFVDNNGNEIHQIPFKSIKNMKIKEQQDTENIKLTIPHNNVTLPTESFYVKITGSTEQGEVFSRLSYVEQNRQTRNIPLITIESSVRSNLIATTGSNPKVIFDVTNNFDRLLFVPFSVEAEKNILGDLMPRGAVIPPKGTAEVTVYTIIPASSTLQYTDLITLTAFGQVRAQKSAIIYVNSATSRTVDTTLPYLNYKYTSTCMEVPHSSCQSGVWSIEVTAQDAESGLLRVVSEPAGLYSHNGYVSGTKEAVTLYYSSDCCQPYLDITAIDLYNNKRTYRADAYNATLSTGSIVAIVLGILIFVIIVIVAVILIRKCCKERDSLDLPRYRGQVGTSRF